MQEKIIILDFGSQTTQLIGRRIRELGEYCEIVPYNKFPADDSGVLGVILSGSPFSVYDEKAFRTDLSAIRGKLPVLGICYGAQFIAYTSGGTVEPAPSREYGRAHLTMIEESDPLMEGIPAGSQVWMSHGDTITSIPDSFKVVASTPEVAIAAYKVEGEPTWGVQFHPEVYHSECGTQILRNFVQGICKGKLEWSADSFIESTVASLREQLGNDKVVLGLSGGVDSSVAAVLLNKAIGKNLTCIFVDHGMLRKNEFRDVLADYEGLGLNVIGVDASAKFFAELKDVTDPERKRKIIGKGFVDVFNEEAGKLKDVKWLAQGTIYPDCIESLSITGTTSRATTTWAVFPRRCTSSSASLCACSSRTKSAPWAVSSVCPNISSSVIPSPGPVLPSESSATSLQRKWPCFRKPTTSSYRDSVIRAFMTAYGRPELYCSPCRA